MEPAEGAAETSLVAGDWCRCVHLSIVVFSFNTRLRNSHLGSTLLGGYWEARLVDVTGVLVTDSSICSFFVAMFSASGSAKKPITVKDISLFLRFPGVTSSLLKSSARAIKSASDNAIVRREPR